MQPDNRTLQLKGRALFDIGELSSEVVYSSTESDVGHHRGKTIQLHDLILAAATLKVFFNLKIKHKCK